LFSLTVLPLVTASMVAVFLTMENEADIAQYPAVMAVAYLLGSVPWGYMLLRWRRGVDIRDYGSGRTGMSNVLRTGGGKVAALVLALDLGKGILAVLLARAVIGTTAGEVATGLAVLAGHNWPVFLQFKGGRGIATGLGGLSVMAPIAAGLAAFAFIPITLSSRILSLGSVVGVGVACVSMAALSLAGVYSSVYTLYAFIGSAIILWQHRDNIRRIRQGTERRLGQPAQPVV
jgi:glycerol-3-phosphate acyltransferase PlsY